ncbi:TPA_asm: RNA-directed RNA polymerase [ssRNA phage SRR7976301_6]|uniref:RNA-directed RNA polymerase n=1 Tax=ssRNA phage SRR7976301_6 TaxID=2786667 RepID=A0A8S5L5T1_9VIRU|nr:RNA-directed RNA polymerase [ssRNA phage SRR7976301_6]DAD52682.1 TPA_asm: RNA-directed RNA polymerase [ssRNA phage SRR7976301_6]
MDLHRGSDPMGEVFFALCKEVDTPISLSAWLRFKYSQKELSEMELPVADYLECHAARFKQEYMVTSFLSKWKGLDTGVDLEAVAIQKFRDSEDQCSAANRFLRQIRQSGFHPINAVLYTAKRKIANLLGPVSLHCIERHFGWGPGATFDLPRRKAQVDHKISTLPITVSSRAAELFQSVVTHDLHWSFCILGLFPDGPWSFTPGVLEVVETCRVETVPKNAKTHRIIAIEPTANLFLQKGIGGYFRRVLKRVGVDLDDQGRNQSLAAEAVYSSYATLDLRAASDTVSREIVYDLLPFDWWWLLDHLRSPKALMPDGDVVLLEKFSSMGNGFTFELESLIFWAISSAVQDLQGGGVCSIYGDDIIVEQVHAPAVVAALTTLGFKLNMTKSYVEGLFFESCGEHYFNGEEVTPAYQKDTFDDTREYIRCHNRLFRWQRRVRVETRALDAVVRASPNWLLSCLLPEGEESDDGYLVDIGVLLRLSQLGPKHHRTVTFNGTKGFRLRYVRQPTRSLPGIAEALYAHTLRLNADKTSSTSVLANTRPPVPKGQRADDVHLPIAERELDDGSTELHFAWRWIIPQGWCPLNRT